MTKDNEHAGKKYKPPTNHPWRRAVPSNVHAWAHEKSRIEELAIKQPNKFKKK